MEGEELLTSQTSAKIATNELGSANNEKHTTLPANAVVGIAAESSFLTDSTVEIESNEAVQPITAPAEPVVTAAPAAPSTPKSKPSPAQNVEPAQGVVPVAAADTPKGLIGNLVSLSSSSAKKLLSTPLGMSLGSANAAASSVSLNDTETDGAQSQTGAGSGAGVAAAPVAKDTSKDKEVALLKKTLKKKNQVRRLFLHIL